ncbi:peroxisome assembly factor 2 [Thrips palmi]|uniref:Peroxisomal ATPase PEX6 n=1 Tax=Thrips palmi TaxID=161013 RepID=A0A6P8Z5A6_THRPL|nr:peroxisome assembly factor 2 [Thrips palmi]
MEETSDLTAESLLGVAKYVMEMLSPSHKLVIRNLEEVQTAFRHDFRSKRTRLKTVAVPQEVIQSLVTSSSPSDSVADHEMCVVVGLRAAVKLGVPVGGACLGFVSKCSCPLLSEKECGPSCQTARQTPKVYAVQIMSNRRVPPYQMLVNETVHHNVITSLYGSSHRTEKSIVLNVRRCDKVIGEGRVGLKYASHAAVSWIQQPQVADDSIISACLSGFFEVPRHLHKGDVFRIKLSEHAPEVLLAPGKFGLKDFYFVILSIDGPRYRGIQKAEDSIGYLVAKGETTLVQDVNKNSFLPCCTLSSKSTLTYFLQKHPVGLKNVYNKLTNALTPFLKGASPGLKPAFLMTGPAGCGKRSIVSSAAAQFGMNFWAVDCAEIKGGTSGQTVGKLRAVLAKAKQYAPCIVLMSNIQILSHDQDGRNDSRVLDEFQDQLAVLKSSKLPIVLVATAASSTDLTSAFARTFLLEIPVISMEKEERKIQLKQLIAEHCASASEECLEDIASRCSGFLLGDLNELVSLAIRNNLCGKQQLEQTVSESPCLNLTASNFGDALEKMQSAYAGSIGAPKIPSVKWNDVGGLESVKKEILQTVTLPLKYPELTAGGLGRSGILLYGPPGTGKTLLAKAVATECNLNFLSVKGPELLNMYVGQSEANVREIFERARGASPCIIFFDELDALAPNRGRSGDSGGVMDRVVSQLLSEMDGLNKSSLLFVIGATNRPDLIDPALLRPGRFDKLLYVGAYEDSSSKLSVLNALTRKFKLTSDVNLEEISKKLPHEVTGADMYAVCSGAWLGAVRRIIKQNEERKTQPSTEVEVNQEDFIQAVSNMVPSVSSEDMLYFKGLREQMSAVPAK